MGQQTNIGEYVHVHSCSYRKISAIITVTIFEIMGGMELQTYYGIAWYGKNHGSFSPKPLGVKVLCDKEW